MKRPETLAQMNAALARFATEHGVEKGLAYRADSTDIFITPYSKCGTTWVSQIAHSLRSDGDMAFDEITDVVPWLELAHDMGRDVNAPQPYRPRLFKSHLPWGVIPEGGRYIVVLRDPVDAMVSLYRFFDGWMFERGAISLEDFAGYYLHRMGREDYWSHASSWWGVRDRDDVLLLAYEHMKRDLVKSVAQVADFMGISDERRRAVAQAQATMDFMKAHGRQFDDHLVRQARDAACGLPPGGEASKVDSGQAGAGRAQVSDAIREAYAGKWRETMGAAHGLESYDDLLTAVKG
ncbi:sulfotransferase domain-containing protein [Roseovarius sp. B08]|uniref:sulfotransferase domain-containing protein n=1 Tax=Roseovarius sp. B08 TaxID=3449223 RepID=UPI003EDC2580